MIIFGGNGEEIIIIEFLKLFGVAGIVVFGVVIFIKPYIKEKAKNLATKEDIKEITHKIEEVKLEYAEKLEAVRASLTSQVHIHQVRYEKEFDILSELTKCVVELRDAAQALRPKSKDIINPNESGEKKEKRLNPYKTAALALYQSSQYNRPFYPEPIFEILNKFCKETVNEAVQYRYTYEDTNWLAYFDEGEKNIEEITKLAEKVISAIRNRAKEWEELGGDTKL